MRPLGSWHEDSCTYSTGAEQCIHGQVLERTVDTKVFVIMIGLFHAQFGHGEICPVYKCEFHE